MNTIPKIIDMIQAWHTDESADSDQRGQLAEIEKAIRALVAAPAQPEATGHAHAHPLYPPQQFRDYVAAHYQGEVVFSDTEWHARRLWNAAMKAGRPEGASAGPVTVQKYDDTLLPFLELMRKELHANTDKGDRPAWLRMSADTALLEIYWHTAKLSSAVKNNDGPAILEHSADVANMAMMLLDVCGGLGFSNSAPPYQADRKASPSFPTSQPVAPVQRMMGDAPRWLTEAARNGYVVGWNECREAMFAAAPARPAAADPHPIDPEVSGELERSDWTSEEALRWYAAGKHYDTVPNGDGTSGARILDNGAVASNALKSLLREYAEHKGDVALLEQPTPAPAAAVDWSQAGRLIEAASKASAHGFMAGTSNWAAAVCRYMDPTTPTRQAADTKRAPVLDETSLPALFREALAWGKAYGEAVPAHQWDEIRESKVAQYANRASCVQAPAGESVGKFPRTIQEQAHD